MIDPDADNDFMRIALRAARNSPDPSVQNGAVIVDRNNMAFAYGHNDTPQSVTATASRLTDRPTKYFYVEHAERNAIFDAVEHGIADSLDGATMYCPWAACADCARAIIAVGIERLVRYPMPPADGWNESILAGDEMMRETGIKIVEIGLREKDVPHGLRLGQWRDS